LQAVDLSILGCNGDSHFSQRLSEEFVGICEGQQLPPRRLELPPFIPGEDES
jgi:hypothetical protein